MSELESKTLVVEETTGGMGPATPGEMAETGSHVFVIGTPVRRRTCRRLTRTIASLTALVSVTLPAVACASETPETTDTASSSSSRPFPSAASPAPGSDGNDVVARLADLESEREARLGVYALDTETGTEISYRGHERFAYASTIKALAAGAVLENLTSRELSRRVFYTEEELIEYSPVTELYVEDGMTVRAIIDAAITVSDNTAGNLLFDLLGGPSALDAALIEDTGDEFTEVVRREPDLNTAVPGDVRDTTSPEALANSLAGYVLGDVLPPADRRLLDRALRRTSTGDALIRAGVPRTWRVGNKTGAAGYGTRNDVAVIRPPGRAPILLAILTTHDTADAKTDDELVAAATRIVVEEMLEQNGDGAAPEKSGSAAP